MRVRGRGCGCGWVWVWVWSGVWSVRGGKACEALRGMGGGGAWGGPGEGLGRPWKACDQFRIETLGLGSFSNFLLLLPLRHSFVLFLCIFVVGFVLLFLNFLCFFLCCLSSAILCFFLVLVCARICATFLKISCFFVMIFVLLFWKCCAFVF